MSVKVTIKYRDLLLAALAVVGLVLAVFVLYHRGLATKALSINNSLLQNLLILDASALIDLSAPSSAEEHSYIKVSLDQNLSDIDRLTKNQLSSSARQIQEIVKAERSILATYDTKLKTVRKILQYNPQDDLVHAGITDEERKTRVANTAKNLQLILEKTTFKSGTNAPIAISKNNVKVSDESGQLLTASAQCFADLERLIQSGPAEAIPPVQSRCISDYSKTKEAFNKDLMTVLSGQAMGEQRIKIEKILNDHS